MPNNHVTDSEMIPKSAAVVEVFTPEMHAYILSLIPTSDSYRELHNQYETSYTTALKGTPEDVKACEALRDAINQNLTILQGVAKVAAIKDPTLPEKLRLTHIIEKTATPTVLTDPRDFKVIYDRKGQIIASVARVLGAKGYQVWVCDDDPNVQANWRLAASSPTCKNIVIPGINRAKNNWLKVRAMRGNGAGPWSNCVTLSPA
jgi:hypothetical protein